MSGPARPEEGLLSRLVRAAVARPFVAFALLALGLLEGARSFGSLPRDVFPDLATPVFNVIVQAPTMGSEEIERRVAMPLERALTGLPGLRRIRSVCQSGIAQTTVELDPDADYFRARQLVGERVALAAGGFPEEVEPPLVSGVSARLNEVIELVLEWGEGAAADDLLALRDFAEVQLRSRIVSVPGVGGFDVVGGELRELSVRADPVRMRARGVSFDEVAEAARGATSLASAGVVPDGEIEWAIALDASAESPEAVGRTVVAMPGGVPVRIADVATVVESGAFRRGIARHRGREVVHVRIIKQIGADAVSVSRGVHAALGELRLPDGLDLAVTYDQAELVEEALSGVGRAVGLGAIFVVLVIVLLLGDFRAAMVVAVGIPVSVVLALAILGRAGHGLNTMTLGGLAIAVGLLVDAAIIVVENAAHRLGLEPAPTRAARLEIVTEAAAEMARPITFATLVVIAVFVPLFGVPGVEGRMYGALAMSVVSAMGAALFVALTATPTAAGWLMRSRRHASADAPEQEPDGFLVGRLKRAYAPALDFAFRRPLVIQLGGAAITVPVLWLGTMVGTDFVPHLDEGYLMLESAVAPEATLATGDTISNGVEEAAWQTEGVLDVTRRTGRGEGTEDPMLHTFSDVLVRLEADRTRTDREIEEDLRARLADLAPGTQVLFTSPLQMRIDEGLGGSPADLSLRIFGPELAVLAHYAGIATARLNGTAGFADVRADTSAESPELSVHFDRDALLRLGVTPLAAIETVQAAMVGRPVGTVFRAGRAMDVRVRALDPLRASPATLAALPIEVGATGEDGARALVPLSRLSRIETHTAPSVIRREAGTRRIAVEASVIGTDLGTAAARARAIAHDLDLPEGYFADVGGRIESQESSSEALGVAVALALVLVLVLLYLAIGNLTETLTILLTVPSALVGGVVALLLSGETWNVSSLVGLLGLFGIAVQNGLVLVTQTRALRAEGKGTRQALREASIGRVRPKLMTAGTAILGLLPLVVLPLRGVELERPLALVMIGGLVTSTLFTLLVLPTFLDRALAWLDRSPEAA
jgi:cobalt-zinc-cadmium resistance protein CzcA